MLSRAGRAVAVDIVEVPASKGETLSKFVEIEQQVGCVVWIHKLLPELSSQMEGGSRGEVLQTAVHRDGRKSSGRSPYMSSNGGSNRQG